MKRRKKTLVALLLAAVTAGLCLHRWFAGTDWRDSLNEFTAVAPGDPHASLASDPAETCVFCHTAKSASAVSPKWGGGGWSSEDSPSAGRGAPKSAVCMSCHDGSLAGGSQSFTDIGSGNHAGKALDPGRSHPIGMRYDSAFLSRAGEFRNPQANSDIRLEDGKVGCVSCHTVHGARPANSRQGIIESACQACHIR
ncbi:MAG: hypothetical protein HZB91_13545 [Elusimicrobia bacterium]|nr:hypothetical protein [Elusimicrobiota bacterium]